jgi:hypothetical protein
MCTEIVEKSEKFRRRMDCSVKQEPEILPVPWKAEDEEEDEKEFPQALFQKKLSEVSQSFCHKICNV